MAEKPPAVYNEDYRPKASVQELREALKTNFWADLSGWMEGRIFAGRNELENPAMPLEDQSFKRGYIRALREVLAMPKEMLEAQIDELEEAQKEDEKNGC